MLGRGRGNSGSRGALPLMAEEDLRGLRPGLNSSNIGRAALLPRPLARNDRLTDCRGAVFLGREWLGESGFMSDAV